MSRKSVSIVDIIVQWFIWGIQVDFLSNFLFFRIFSLIVRILFFFFGVFFRHNMTVRITVSHVPFYDPVLFKVILHRRTCSLVDKNITYRLTLFLLYVLVSIITGSQIKI